MVLNTVKFHAVQPKAIMDFSVTIPDDISNACSQPNSDEIQAELTPYFIQQPSAIVFQYVRQDGNKQQLLKLLSEGHY